MRFALVAVSACALAILGGTEAQAQDHSHAAALDHSHAAAPGQPLVIEVNMADYSFSPEPLRIPAGQLVTLLFTNTGEVEHEFMAGRNVLDGDFEVDLFAGLNVEIHVEEAGRQEETEHAVAVPAGHDNSDGHHDGDQAHGTMVLLQEGGRTSMTFTLPLELRGEWETGCFLSGHYGKGMHGLVTVY